MPRTPQPQMLPVKPHIRQHGDINNDPHSPQTDISLIRTRRNDDDDIQVLAASNFSRDPEATSSQRPRSNHDENTYMIAAASDVPDSLIPKQVSESYRKSSNESVALQRKSSVRKLQQQHYIILDNIASVASEGGAGGRGSPPLKPSRTHKHNRKNNS